MNIDRERFLGFVSLLSAAACGDSRSLGEPAAPAPTAVMTVASVAPPDVGTAPPPPPPVALASSAPTPSPAAVRDAPIPTRARRSPRRRVVRRRT